MTDLALVAKPLAVLALLVAVVSATARVRAEAEAAGQSTPSDRKASTAAPPDTKTPLPSRAAKPTEPIAVPVNALEGQQDKPGSEHAGPKALEARLAKWRQVDWETLAKKDQLKFVQAVRKKCTETLVDFTATFHKQERIRGKLRKKESALIKCRSKPFGVYLKFIKGDKGREALYVDGKYDNKIQAHPGGVLGPLFQVKIAPDSDIAMKDNLRPITMAGMVNMLHTVVPQFEQAEKNGDLKTAYLGKMDIGGRKAYAIKRILPKKDIYPCKELVFFIDVEELVPIGADSYGWDGQLESTYRYTDFKINVGLTDDDFDRKNKTYNF